MGYAAPAGADMKCVSTAFVGQVSAASSPATAKLKGPPDAVGPPEKKPMARAADVPRTRHALKYFVITRTC
jgi:hypothetical protein